MNVGDLIQKWKDLVNKMNDKGIPLPMVRDPDTGEGSVALTLVFISFNLCVVGLMGKYSGYLGGVDMGQSLSLFGICAGLYWGRKFQSDGKGSIVVDEKSKVDSQEPK